MGLQADQVGNLLLPRCARNTDAYARYDIALNCAKLCAKRGFESHLVSLILAKRFWKIKHCPAKTRNKFVKSN